MRRKFAVLAVVGALTVGIIGASAAPAMATVYRGNFCGDTSPFWYVDNSYGSEACINRGYLAPHQYFYMTPGAYDYQSNGKSALNDWKVWQYYSGGWHLYRSGTCYVSSGYGYTNLCSQHLISRVKNSAGAYIATTVLIQIRACSYDSGAGVRSACTSYVNKVNSAW